TDKVYELQPGLYRDAGLLNALTNNASCAKSVFHLNPGRYYFDFQTPGTHRWTVSDGYLVGGTATAPLNIASPPAMPGSCVAPGPRRHPLRDSPVLQRPQPRLDHSGNHLHATLDDRHLPEQQHRPGVPVGPDHPWLPAQLNGKHRITEQPGDRRAGQRPGTVLATERGLSGCLCLPRIRDLLDGGAGEVAGEGVGVAEF